MALTASSETAIDIGAVFLKFKEPVPEAATEVTALISELFAISSALLELDTAKRDHPYLSLKVNEDQEIVLRSLRYTFSDIKKHFGRLADPFYRSTREAYHGVWWAIDRFFREESYNSLCQRLEYYRLFLLDLGRIVEGLRPSLNMRDNQYRIEKLLRVQEANTLELGIDSLAIGAPRQPSWERMRPVGPFRALNAPPGPRIHRNADDLRFPVYDDYDYSPPVPEVPISPPLTTTTTSSQSSYDDQRPGEHYANHWLVRAFGKFRSTTQFNKTGSESKCHGEHHPHASSNLRSESDELLELPFETGFLKMRIYIRPGDRRARLLCKMERNGHRIQSSLPVTSLRILRKASCLQICEQGRRNELIMWTNLRFPSYEKLVLFHCMFLALKMQDRANPVRHLEDTILHDETIIFSAVIKDDDYDHNLKILVDNNSSGVRLLASAMDGRMKRVPIWTAFINYNVASQTWARLYEDRKVHLHVLDRYIFTDDYIPQMGPNGVNELVFKYEQGSRYRFLAKD